MSADHGSTRSDALATGAPLPRTPIRVLHIIKTLGLGGAETNLLNLVSSFEPDRIESHVGYSHGGEIEPRFKAAGVTLFKYAEGSHTIKSLHSIPTVLRLARYIHRHRIDIVQTHNFNGHIWGLLAAKLGGAKVIEHVHDFRYTPTDELAKRHGLLSQYRYIKYFRNRSDRIVVLTKAHRDYVIDHRFAPAGSVVEIQNGIRVDDTIREASALRTELALPDDAIVILTSARMDPSKNVDLILRIASTIVARKPKAVFVIAGSGASLAAYRAQVDATGLSDHVRFIGFRQDTYQLLATADIFLLPSFLELHSIAILEALRMRVPVVVSRDVGCNDEFIADGSNGFLCDPFQEAPWIDAICRLVDDPALRKSVGDAGFETCKRLFAIPQIAQRFERLYEELLDTRWPR